MNKQQLAALRAQQEQYNRTFDERELDPIGSAIASGGNEQACRLIACGKLDAFRKQFAEAKARIALEIEERKNVRQ